MNWRLAALKNGLLDAAALERLIKAQIKGGVDGIVPVGTTGESPAVSYEEHIELIKRATIAGKSHTADIKLRGLWVGKSAFIIVKEPERFVIVHCGERRRTRVNGEAVEGQQALQDGDVITVGSTKMRFNMKQ